MTDIAGYLSTLKPDDIVTVATHLSSIPGQLKVTRLTDQFVVCQGGMRFRRVTGRQTGKSDDHYYIVTPGKGAEIRAKYENHITYARARSACEGVMRWQTPDRVRAAQKALAELEAVMRTAGVWGDVT